MKKIADALFIIFNILAIFLTAYLLNINDQKICKIGDFNIIACKNDVNSKIKKGSLILTKNSYKYVVGDNLLCVKTQINTRVVEDLEVVRIENKSGKNTYIFGEDKSIEEQNVSGLTKKAIVIPVLGYLIGFFEIENVYFLAIILPLFILFILQFVFSGSSNFNVKQRGRVSKKGKNKKAKQYIRTNIPKKPIPFRPSEEIEVLDENIKKLNKINKEYINLIKTENEIDDIDINEYYKAR